MKKFLFALLTFTALSSCRKDFVDKVATSKGFTPVRIHFSLDQNGFDKFYIVNTATNTEYTNGVTRIIRGDASAHDTASNDIYRLIGGDVNSPEPSVEGTILINVNRNPATFTDNSQTGDTSLAKGTGTWYIQEATGIYSNIKGGTGTLNYSEILYFPEDDEGRSPIFIMDMDGYIKDR